MKKTKFKNQNAITLVALVITILVLLILAGVALSLVVGENGITERAITASKTYDIAGAKEQVETLVGQYASEFYEKKYIKGSTTADTIGKYISEKLNGQTVGDYTISTTDSQEITITNGTNTATGKINDNGSTEWNSSATTAKWAYSTDESGNTVITDGTQVLKIGDYVNYDPKTGVTKTTETSYEAQNGYGDQVFDLTTYNNGWRVLGVDESTGEVLLVAEKFVGPKTGGYTNSTYGTTYYYLKGQDGYQNGTQELNKISALYGQGKYATGGRSITVEDVNKITGFNPSTYSGYGSKHTINGSEYTNTYYWYSAEELIPMTSTGYKLIFGNYEMIDGSRTFTGTGAPPMYWLGSQFVNCDPGNASWGLRCVNIDGFVYSIYLANSHGIEDSYYFGVLPVVSLQSGIQLEYNTTKEEWDFVK